jgi:hypothetical protein
MDDWAWRIPTLLQAGIPAIQICLLWMVPESPRWLISQDRDEEARLQLIKYHAGGDENSPLVDFEMQEIKQVIAMENEAAKNTTWTTLWATAGNRKRLAISITLGVFSQWNGVGTVCSVPIFPQGVSNH